jgi:hypothetical protein
MKTPFWGRLLLLGVAAGVAVAATPHPNTTGCLTGDDRPAMCRIKWPGHQGGVHFHLVESHFTSSATDFRVVVDLSKVYGFTLMAT